MSKTNDRKFLNSVLRHHPDRIWISVDLGLPSQEPPGLLFHGGVAKYLVAIGQEGLKKRARQRVHLSTERETATSVFDS